MEEWTEKSLVCWLAEAGSVKDFINKKICLPCEGSQKRPPEILRTRHPRHGDALGNLDARRGSRRGSVWKQIKKPCARHENTLQRKFPFNLTMFDRLTDGFCPQCLLDDRQEDILLTMMIISSDRSVGSKPGKATEFSSSSPNAAKDASAPPRPATGFSDSSSSNPPPRTFSPTNRNLFSVKRISGGFCR